MKLKLTALLLTLGAGAAFAGPTCNAPKDKWIKEADFQTQLKSQGYQIKTFKVTKGNCYEIYGKDKDNKKVEIYFDPATAAIVKEERE